MRLTEIMNTSHRHFDGYPNEMDDRKNHLVHVELVDGATTTEIDLNVLVDISPAEYDRGNKYADGDFQVDEVTFKSPVEFKGYKFNVGDAFPSELYQFVYDNDQHSTIEDYLRNRLDGEVDVE